MKKTLLVLGTAFLLGGCIKLISDYDEVIDRGVTDFAEQFTAHVKNMGDLGGKAEGTHDANIKVYNGLDAKLDVLISRAASASEGKGCKLEKKLYDRIEKLLKTETPAELKAAPTASEGDPQGCNARLLVLVKRQLAIVREIHRDADKCGPRQDISCLRPATAKSALEIAHQSINAVAIVENAKKTQ